MHWNIKDTPLKETTAHLIECLGVDAIDGAAVTIVLIRMISRPRSVLLVRVTPQEPKASENSTTHSFGRAVRHDHIRGQLQQRQQHFFDEKHSH